jgi:hypothetical protein
MKKSIAIAAVILLAVSGASAQLDLADFQSAFEGFAGDMAGSLAMNSTIGSNWSTRISENSRTSARGSL